MGAGNNSFDNGGSDDLVCTGSGNDTGTLGAGDCIVNFTINRLRGSQAKTIKDFNTNHNNKIEIDSTGRDLIDTEGQSTKAV